MSHAHARRRPGRTFIVAALAALALPAGVLVATSQAAAVSVPVKLVNPALEHATGATPNCWQPHGSGTNSARFTRLSTGHSGRASERVAVSSYRSGSRELVVGMRSTCAPAVIAGATYTTSTWYKSSGLTRWATFYLSKSTGKWVPWATSGKVATTSSWRRSRFTTPPMPADAARLSFGLSLRSRGALTVDDFALSYSLTPSSAQQPDAHRRRTAPTPTATTSTSSTPTSTPTSSPVSSPTPTPTSSTTAPSGATWFVSRAGDNSSGRSWGSAWSELANVDWSVVRPGDVIEVDGGSSSCGSDVDITAGAPGVGCGMVYSTALTVKASGLAGLPVTVRLSSEAGHNGTAVVFGGRSTALPYCDQSSYAASGSARSAGITVAGQSNVVIDGSHRSGFMVYGAQNGVDLASDATSFVTLRNLEIFDNGTFSTWANGYRTDGDGVLLAGHDITIDRDLIHDNGQDEIHDRYTGALNNNSHAALSNITVSNSWLYDHRGDPLFPGYGFNAGAQAVAAQNCTHVDGLQIWGGGLHQKNLTFDHDLFGPMIAQGVYPGDQDNASFDNVTVTNSLFLDVLNHSIIGDSIATDSTTPHGWLIDHITSYQAPSPPGTRPRGAVDLAGTGHTVQQSIFVDGYFTTAASLAASGNDWFGGDAVPGGRHVDPGFPALPTTDNPSYHAIEALDLIPTCTACVGIGSPLHSVDDLLRRIDELDGH